MSKLVVFVIIFCISFVMYITLFFKEGNPKSRNLPKPKTYFESSYSKVEVEAKYPPAKTISLESAHKPVSFEHKTDVTERTSPPDIKVKHRVLSQKNIIFVVAYMRSGSTMTASFLEANPGTFYRFEPLGGVYNKFKETKAKTTQLRYSTGTRTYKITEMSNVMKKEIQAWLTCNMTLLSMESILDEGFNSFSKVLKTFNSCYKETSQNETIIQSKQCFRDLEKVCINSPSIVLKFIRLSIKDAVYFLPSFPNMKIIHLVRDPRGIISSQDNVGFHQTKNASIENLCKDIQSNLFWTKKVFQQYRNRIKIVHYEDIAENPFQLVQEIYSFVGYNYSTDTEYFVKSVTASTNDSCSFCIKRKNSTETASKWRLDIKEELAHNIYHRCKDSMGLLGYLPLENDIQLKNTNVASRVKQNTSKQVLQSNFTVLPNDTSWLHQTLYSPP